MGTVYLAEQLEPIRRRVALKVVKLGMDTAQVLARFDSERSKWPFTGFASGTGTSFARKSRTRSPILQKWSPNFVF